LSRKNHQTNDLQKALERWETQLGNCEVTLQVIGPFAKSLTKTDRPKVPTAVRGPLGIIYHPNEKANAIEDCLEKKSISHDLCDEDRERRVETRVQTLLASVDDIPLGNLRPCGKGKVFPDAWGSGCIDPSFLDLGTSWKLVFSFTPEPLYPRGKSFLYPLNRRLGGPQSRSGRHAEEKILAPMELELRLP
jgi:hypothetical protein